MNYKARAISSKPLTEAHIASIITRGKPIDYKTAVALVGMIVVARGDEVEGVKMEAAPPPAPDEDIPPAMGELTPDGKEKISLDDCVSSEDGKTPWMQVIHQAQKDDRLMMAIEEGLIHPVKKTG